MCNLFKYSDGEIPSGFIVSVGLHDYTEDDSTQTMTIEEIILHPQYTYYAEGLDVAVLILAEAIEMNERAAPACLPTRLPRVGDKCIASGWGRLSRKPLLNIHATLVWNCFSYPTSFSTMHV